MIGQRRCSQTMNCCWIFLENSRLHVVVPRGPRLLPLAPFTFYTCVCTNNGLGLNLSKYAFDIQEMVAYVLNREMVLLLLIVMWKFVAYFIFLNLTSMISSTCNSHPESEEESMILSRLSESCGSLSSCSILVVLSVHIWPIISFTWSFVLWDLHFSLSEWVVLYWFVLWWLLSVLSWCTLLCWYDLLKYLAIFLVAASNSVMWSVYWWTMTVWH